MLSSSIDEITGEVQGQRTSTFLVPERSKTTDNFVETSLALATEASSVHYLFSSTTILPSEISSEPSLQTFTSVLTSFTLAESHVQSLTGTLTTRSTAALSIDSGMLETLGSSMSGLSRSSELLSPAVTAAETTGKVSTSATPSVEQPSDWSHSLAPSSTMTPTLPYLEMTSMSDVVVKTEAPPTKSVPLFSSLEVFSSNPSSIISLPVGIEESSLSNVFSSDVLVTDALPLSSFSEPSSLIATSSEVVTGSSLQSLEEFPPSQTSIISKTPPISETHLVSVSSSVVDSLTVSPMFSQTGTMVSISTYESLVEHTTGIQPSEALTASALTPFHLLVNHPLLLHCRHHLR
ncbi:hypothetical protein C0Q70_04551 [Pomacea canaliculata]|uniref:Uncharacterized protein n=1 Tax=Pomacea canaliculata TaxID=400727 RepID=A0A2T7PIQ3_POMCA|nr:hypothetical protein C0Q70_04551 [Pomacea canaliculata]